MVDFIAEVSSNHLRNIERCYKFVDIASSIGCDAVKFQLFRIDELFSSEALAVKPELRIRKSWELPRKFIPLIKQRCIEKNIKFCCTPFSLTAVNELAPYVDIYKIASYEILWLDLIKSIAKTSIPLIISTGMATLPEVQSAIDTYGIDKIKDLSLLHCVSNYPALPEQCNLSAIKTIKQKFNINVGWSDHTRNPHVVHRAISKFGAEIVEFHLDIDERGPEYATGHCWLPNEIEEVIKVVRQYPIMDGDGEKKTNEFEKTERGWRADPSDGLRPLKATRLNI